MARRSRRAARALPPREFAASFDEKTALIGDIRLRWLEHVLLPILTPGQTVVMDNLRAHYRKEVRALIEAHSCTLLYLPPYSPDFSPIELAFSKIKGQRGSFAARNQAIAYRRYRRSLPHCQFS